MAIEVKLTRSDRTYKPPDVLDGYVIVTASSVISHQAIRITLTGTILLEPSSRSVGVIESLITSVKAIQILNKSVDISVGGKIDIGKTEIPFRIALNGPNGGFDSLYETYHGSSINIQYLITAEVIRGYLQKNLSVALEFIVENGEGKVHRPLPAIDEGVYFYITQDTQKHPLLPSICSGGFRVTGRVATKCYLGEPIRGEMTVESSAAPISSIDIRLLQLESMKLGDRTISDATEMHITQVADGDVCRGLPIPIHVILPRLLTCPTLSLGSFSIEFQLSIMVTFEAELSKLYSYLEPDTPKQWVAYETLPLRLIR